MISGATWTPEERTFLEYLTGKVSMLRLQDAKTVWRLIASPRALAFKVAIQRLTAAGLVERYQLNLHPPLKPRAPLLHVAVGHRFDIAAEDVAEQAQRRWSKPHRPTLVLVSSRRAANLFGSTSRSLPPFWSWNHDALLGEVFVHYQATQPALLEDWVGEHLLPKAGYRIKDPDAFLVRDGLRYRIVESGGRYSAKQIQGLVDYAISNELELEIW